MRKALIVGIDFYLKIPPLYGCVADAQSVKRVLERHTDGNPNFGVKFLASPSRENVITRSVLKDNVEELFSGDGEIALLYFAGHGHSETTGGYLCPSDCARGDDGLALSDVMTLANRSGMRNRVIILDNCHAGIAGANALAPQISELSEGMTILAASTEDQYATESKGSGIFTTLLVDALNGGAANLVGEVTPGSVYAHVDQSLGPWEQRPVFKTNVKSFVSLRKVRPPISLDDLRRLPEFFPAAGFDFPLDPTFEPERAAGDLERGIPPPNIENTKKFAILQSCNRVNLVVPVDAPHMWHAAMNRKSCRLTVLGQHYHRLAAAGRI
jgi:Caspase domain